MSLTNDEKKQLKTYFSHHFLLMDFDVNSPKAKPDGTFSEWAIRYENYKHSKNSNHFLELGGTINDLINDFQSGRVSNLKLVNPNVIPLHEQLQKSMDTRNTLAKELKEKERIEKKQMKIQEKARNDPVTLRLEISSLKNELELMTKRALDAEVSLRTMGLQ
jgi:predicted esterase YcpF (UPF0227 family)